MEYIKLAEAYSELENTSKRLHKTFIISQLLKETSEEDLEHIIMLLQGRVFTDADDREIGVAAKLVLKAISVSTGFSISNIEKMWKEIGDLGEVAEKLCGKKTQNTLFSSDLDIKEVFSNLQKLASLEGMGSVDQKVKLISKLLTSAKPLEAKYVVRTVLQDLRVGVAEGTLRDAIAWAYLPGILPNYDLDTNQINPENREEYNFQVEAVQSALNKINDFSKVAITAKKGIEELNKIKIVVGKPLKVMLAQKVLNVVEAFETVGKPAVLEFKYDGFRMQIHKFEDKVTIFTRRLEEVTNQFPEVEDFVLNNVSADSCILDCEAAGFDSKTGKYTPFQSISQRIKRKYDIEKMAKDFPVELNIFDIIYFNGEDLLSTPFKERRAIIERIVKEEEKKIVLSKKIISSSEEEAQEFFDESISLGNEGLMFKNLEGVYKPGSRVGYMIKLKDVQDPLDVVILGGEWGQGKRSGWVTSLTIGILSNDGFLEIGHVGTGLKEKPEEGLSFGEITELLRPNILEEKGRELVVKPSVVISIEYEEIQKSPGYSSGFALRFPRVKLLRSDRRSDEITTLEEVEDLFYNQKKS
ncbi:ATP-dependent DNA ligase [Candidatus Woesearchaeota archaeon]|nr:ATP-dependent DNA ligase [Candidatus Woesearchaeota archaeon]MCF7901384.1 ATP-dependent DNA ligase [Candidatus Woesearchaeota archaeon]MCF8013145.1 ATP-dependent DNA ligase [Candidatus Woesearchaeota archaeon]